MSTQNRPMTTDELYKQLHNIILNLTSGMEMLHSQCSQYEATINKLQTQNAQLTSEKEQWAKVQPNKEAPKSKIIQKAKN